MTHHDKTDPCGVCGTSKNWHDGKSHKWTETDELIPVDGARLSGDKSTPPMKRETPQTASLYSTRMTVRLIEVLTKKGLLSPDELFFIFGGAPDGDSGTAGSSTAEAGVDRSEQSAERGSRSDTARRSYSGATEPVAASIG